MEYSKNYNFYLPSSDTDDTADINQISNNFRVIDEVLSNAGGGGGTGTGENGATFTPSVSTDGVISWTNDKGLANPSPVNIKGEKGEQGIQGDQGIQGIQGIQGERGLQGEQGIQGEKGADGAKGDKGEDGVGIKSVVQTTTSNDDGGSNVITVTKTDNTASTFTVKNGSKGSTGAKGDKGDKGDTGASGMAGEDGKSAYAYAQDGGYTGTEADFAKQLAIEIKYTEGLNLFNKATVTSGYYITSKGALAADSSCSVTDFIPVKPNTTYTKTEGAYGVVQFDANKANPTSAGYVSTFTTSATTYFVRFTILSTLIDSYVMVEGDKLPNGYVPYGRVLTIAGNVIPIEGVDTSVNLVPLFNKLGVIGDSLSNQEKWQPTVLSMLNIPEWHKNAITGSCVANYESETITPFVDRYLDTPEDCDCIVIMGGTNDGAKAIGNMGTVGVCNRNTFKGAYSTIIDGLLSRNPSTRIMLITPPRCYTATNTLNTSIKPIVDAVKEIAEYYGLPCLDLYNGLGINDKTYSYMLYDNVHFSVDGGLRLGRLIGNFIKNNY